MKPASFDQARKRILSPSLLLISFLAIYHLLIPDGSGRNTALQYHTHRERETQKENDNKKREEEEENFGPTLVVMMILSALGTRSE